MKQEQRGLRFPFNADAEITLENSSEAIPARVMELSLRGCFLEISFSLKEQQRVRLKIFFSGEYAEVLAEVIYLRPAGAGLLFQDMKPHSRRVLQTWILAALDRQPKSEHS
jgi:PilZ domain